MNINTKTQLQKDLEAFQADIDKSKNLVANAIDGLNATRSNLWSLPDDRLQALLQNLQDNDLLQSMLDNHLSAAEDLNFIAGNIDIPNRAAIGRGREFTVTDGVVALEALPDPVDTPDYDPASEPEDIPRYDPPLPEDEPVE